MSVPSVAPRLPRGDRGVESRCIQAGSFAVELRYLSFDWRWLPSSIAGIHAVILSLSLALNKVTTGLMADDNWLATTLNGDRLFGKVSADGTRGAN